VSKKEGETPVTEYAEVDTGTCIYGEDSEFHRRFENVNDLVSMVTIKRENQSVHWHSMDLANKINLKYGYDHVMKFDALTAMSNAQQYLLEILDGKHHNFVEKFTQYVLDLYFKSIKVEVWEDAEGVYTLYDKSTLDD
jgi:hypothetical protein